jgi:hypothetical protein
MIAPTVKRSTDTTAFPMASNRAEGGGTAALSFTCVVA